MLNPFLIIFGMNICLAARMRVVVVIEMSQSVLFPVSPVVSCLSAGVNGEVQVEREFGGDK